MSINTLNQLLLHLEYTYFTLIKMNKCLRKNQYNVYYYYCIKIEKQIMSKGKNINEIIKFNSSKFMKF